MEEHLVLRHLGHRSEQRGFVSCRTAVLDLHFNPEEPMTIASTSDDSETIGGGTVEIWRPHEMLLVDINTKDGKPSPAVEEYVSYLKKK